MSYCRCEGKDTINFVTKEDHEKPSTVKVPEPEPGPSLIKSDGSINWNCPCLGGMATGPCGIQLREAFSCFHYSKAEPKGSNCLSLMEKMRECMEKYPRVYKNDDEEDSSTSKNDMNFEVNKGLENTPNDSAGAVVKKI